VATTPTIVDVDGDRRPDVVVALQDTAFGSQGSPVYGFISAFSSRGNRREGGAVLPGYPITATAVAQGYGTAQDFITEGIQTPAAYVEDGVPRLVANAGLSFSQTYDLRRRSARPAEPARLGQEGPVNPPSPLVHFSASPSVGRLGGRPEVMAVQGSSAAGDIAAAVATTPGLGIRVRSAHQAWNASTGALADRFTRPIQGLAFVSAPAIADVSGDGRADSVLAADSGAIHAFDGVTGEPVDGWPKWSGGWSLWTPAVGDLDGDGRVEVVAGVREGYLRAWRTPGRVEANDQAWHWHQNDRATGLLGEDTRPPSAVRDLRVQRRATSDVVSFAAPGDDWLAGRARTIEVYRSRRPFASREVGGATLVRRVRADASGATMRLQLARPRTGRRIRSWSYTARAVDDAGNIGPLPARDGASACLSRRVFTIRVREPRGRARVRRATVVVDGRRVRTRRTRGGRLVARVDLRRRPPGAFRVRIVARTTRGRTVRETRTYRTCERRRPSRRPGRR